MTQFGQNGHLTEKNGNGPRVRAVLPGAKAFSPLRNPAFRFLWISMFCSTTGMQTQFFARGLLAYELGGTAAAIGVVGLGQAIPGLILSIIGGVVADRVERRTILIVGQALTAILAIIVAVMVKTEVMTIPYLFISGLLLGTLMAFGGPARQAIVPEIAGQNELMNALALNNAGMNLSRIATPSFSAALVSISGIDIGGLFVAQACLNSISLACLLALPFAKKGSRAVVAAAEGSEPASGSRPRRPRRSMAHDLAEGFRYVVRSPILVTLLAMGLVPTLLGQSYQSFLPVFAKDVFGDGIERNAGAIGVMGTVSGIGALAGSLTVALMAAYPRRTLIQLVSGLGFGFLLASFAIQSNYIAAVLCLGGVGFMSSFFQSLNTTMTMTASDPQYHGRVMSINQLTFSMTAFGTFFTGYLIDWVGRTVIGPLELEGVQVAFFGIGLIMTAFLVTVTIFNPSYRHLEQDDLRRFGQSAKEETQVEAAAADRRGLSL